jgi:uncharacterized protein (DUF952 family)
MSTTIFHITTSRAWHDAKQLGFFQSTHFDEEKFIHCSTPTQVLPVLRSLFTDISNLVILEIEQEALLAPVVYEGEGELFPHIYGKLNIGAVRAVHDVVSKDHLPVPLGLFKDILIRPARETDDLEFAGIGEDDVFERKIFVAESQGCILAAAERLPDGQPKVISQEHLADELADLLRSRI